MLHGPQQGIFDLSFAIPAECADRLTRREADIGIVPVIEMARQHMQRIPGVGIACHGAVRSILLASKVPLREIRVLAADSSSRTSVNLARIILSKKYGAAPRVISHLPDLPTMLGVADAALVIGDPALRLDPAKLPFEVLDLGAEWLQLTGLPMVFAAWAARKDFDMTRIHPEAFVESYRFGREHLDDLVRMEHEQRGVTTELAREYLTRYIAFELGEKELAGMERFLEYAAELPATLELEKVPV